MNSADVNADMNGGLNNAELVNKDSFERLKSKNRRKEIRRKIFYLFIAVLLCAIIGIICIVFFFGLKTIEVKGNDRYSAEEILSVCGFDASTNLFGIDFGEAEAALKKEFPYIREVHFKRVLPSTLEITVAEDAPTWCTEIAGDWFVLSKDLRVIARYDLREEVDILSLSVIDLILPETDYVVSGEQVRFVKQADYAYLVSFLNELSTMEIFSSVDCIDASDRYHMALYTNAGRYKILIGDSDSLDTKIRFVNKVIEDSFDERTIASINVEYISSIIVLKQSEPFEYR